jgi:hypothetical protein
VLAEVWQVTAGWGGWPFLGFIIPVLVAIMAAALPYWHNQLVNQLADPADRASIRAELTTDAAAGRRFRDGVDRLLGLVDRYFGPPLGLRAFDRCLLHAYLYPIVLFVIAWAAGAPGGLRGIELLVDLGAWERVWRGAVFVLSIAVAFGWAWFVFSRLNQIDAAIRRRIDAAGRDSSLKRAVPARSKNLLKELITVAAAGVVAGVAAAVVALVAAVVAAVAVAGAVAAAAAAIVAGVAAGVVAVAGAAAVAGASAVAAALGAVIAAATAGAAAAAIITFYVALPAANAALDWLSWLITRRLLRRPPDGDSTSRLAVGMGARLFFDLGFAFASLCLLAIVLPNTIEIANSLFIILDWPMIAWRPLLDQAVAAPFSSGVFVTGMLLTTLVPTLLHVAAGLFGVFAVWSLAAREAVRLIPADPAGDMRPSAQQRTAWLLVRRRLWLIPAALSCIPLVAALTYGLTFFTGPIGLFLADLAIWSTGWAHGLQG